MLKFRIITFSNDENANKLIQECKTKNETDWISKGVKLVRCFKSQEKEKIKVILLLSFREKEIDLKLTSNFNDKDIINIENIAVLEAPYYPLRHTDYPVYQMRIYSIRDPASARK